MAEFQIKAFLFFFLPLFFLTFLFYLATQRKIRFLNFKKNKRLGGFLVGLSFLFFLCFFKYFFPNFLLFKDFISLILGVLVLVIGGLWDDLKNITWKKQLFFQVLAAGIALMAGDTINHIRLPLGEVLFFPDWLSFLSAFFWIILMLNALNWFDGVDGLAGSQSLINLLILSVLSVSPIVNQPDTALLCLIIAGVLLAFLFFNFPPAKVFLGSSGVWTIGFLIAVISIYSGGKIATTALIFGFPLLDFFWVSSNRIAKGISPTKGKDRLHFHECLLDAGFNPSQITLFLSFISLILGIGAVLTQTQGKFFLLFFLLALFLILVFPLKKALSSKRK